MGRFAATRVEGNEYTDAQQQQQQQ